MQTPSELAEILMRKSAEFGKKSDLLAEILEIKAKMWMELRKECKSDTSTERAWQSTVQGIEEMKLKLSLKALEKQMGAIRAHLKVKSDEVHNLY